MEFKDINDVAKLDDATKEALEQIKKSKYTNELQSRGILNICTIGIAFSRKAIRLVTDYRLSTKPNT